MFTHPTSMHSCFNVRFLQLYHRGAVVKWSLFLFLSNLFRSAPWTFKSSSLLSLLLLSSSLPMSMHLLFSLGDTTHASSASSSISILSSLLSLRVPHVLLLLLSSSLKASEDGQELVKKPPPIADSTPASQFCQGRAQRSHYIQCLPPCCCL